MDIIDSLQKPNSNDGMIAVKWGNAFDGHRG